jgi:hypothetical protein
MKNKIDHRIKARKLMKTRRDLYNTQYEGERKKVVKNMWENVKTVRLCHEK